MKVLGVTQFQQKKFKTLGFAGKWLAAFGNVEDHFSMIVYGQSGNGKTEMCMQLARYLCEFDKVAWLSYEQGHGLDLRMAVDRNNMDEVAGKFLIIDPLASRKKDMSFFEELEKYLSRRSSPKFIIIDSVDYCSFTWEQVKYLKERFRNRKSLIWISHAAGNHPKSEVAKKIEYDAGIKVNVKKFIAYIRSRYGGMEDFIIYEEKAREMNPLYFKDKR